MSINTNAHDDFLRFVHDQVSDLPMRLEMIRLAEAISIAQLADGDETPFASDLLILLLRAVPFGQEEKLRDGLDRFAKLGGC